MQVTDTPTKDIDTRWGIFEIPAEESLIIAASTSGTFIDYCFGVDAENFKAELSLKGYDLDFIEFHEF
ncbi:MAG: hypothetical protein F6K19_45950 [Cyanothece sp. SIO1E1]|nr:hypothetical protein [Cyanothece sp. SIO1E1]